MPRAEGSIYIQRSVADVFAFLAAGENNPRWRTGIMDIQHASGSPAARGAVYRQGMKGAFGRVAADYEITECIPNQVLAFRVTAGPARPEGRYEFAPENSGTRLRFALSWQAKGLALFLVPVVAAQMPRAIASLERLKAVLEAEQ